MTLPAHLLMVLSLAAAGTLAAAEPPVSSCLNVEGDAILARDLAQALPVFSALPPDTRIGYAPIPGVRRFFYASELRRLSARYHIAFSNAGGICFERTMETLQPERVAQAMRQALGQPGAHIEIKELSQYPVPHGEVRFDRSTLPAAPSLVNIAPQLWRGFVKYGGDHRFAIWARATILVRAARVVATEDLPAGHPIQAHQVRIEEFDAPPSNQPPPPSLEQVVGKWPRKPIVASAALTALQVEEPKDIERGALVAVDVRCGGAHLALPGRALADGRKGDTIPIRNTVNGKTFSARVQDKDHVVLTATLPSILAKDQNQ
ncbi:MAG: flagellar basal body P-ring formation chaperone FlgA [Acidobacteriia bacterium]|nr:flagellar basal body P-ring formation chaperone FlgA [Terriglobia bacterium]